MYTCNFTTLRDSEKFKLQKKKKICILIFINIIILSSNLCYS